jgi:hypothetical protein
MLSASSTPSRTRGDRVGTPMRPQEIEWTSAPWLGAAASLIAVSSGATLIASVAYDWGYLFALSIGFSQVPTSIGDHVRTALLWLPNTVIGLLIVSVFELATRRIEGGKTEDEIMAGMAHDSWIARFRRSPSSLFLIGAVLVLVLYTLLGDIFWEGVPVAVVVLWACFLSWVYAHPVVRARTPRVARLVLLLGGMLLILVVGSGYAAGRRVFRDTPHDVVTLQSGQQLTVIVLRTLDKGLLVKVAGLDFATFVPWSDVRSMRSPIRRHRVQGLLCSYLGKCRPEGNP